MQRKKAVTVADRAALRGVSEGEQRSYENSSSIQREELRGTIGKAGRRPVPRRKQKKSLNTLDSGVMGGALRGFASLTKDKGRSYRA